MMRALRRASFCFLTIYQEEGRLSAPRDDATTDPVAQGFITVRNGLRRARRLNRMMHSFLRGVMDLNDEIGGELDADETALTQLGDRVQQHTDDMQHVIDDLKAQIAAGSGGLTAAQSTALLGRLRTLHANMDATAQFASAAS